MFERIRLHDRWPSDYNCETLQSHAPPRRAERGGCGRLKSSRGPCRRAPVCLLAMIVSLIASSAGADDSEAEKMSNDRPDRPLADAAGLERDEGSVRRLRAVRAAGGLGAGDEGALRHPRGPGGPVRRRAGRVHRLRRPQAARGARRALARGPGGVSAVLRRRREEAAGPGRGTGGAGDAREALLVLLPHLGRRQRGRSPGRPLLRAGAVRPRRRLLAGDPPGAARLRALAGPDDGQGRPGAGAGRAAVGARRASDRRRPTATPTRSSRSGAGRRRRPSTSSASVGRPRARPRARTRHRRRATARRRTSPRRSPPPGRSGSAPRSRPG